MKHPAFRVRNILHLDPEVLLRFKGALLESVSDLPFNPRIEICGSYAIGCARIESDIDINLAAPDWNEQVKWRRLWKDRTLEAAIKKRLKPFTDEFGLKTEVVPCCPDNKAYNVAYDVLDGVLYGEQGEFSLKWQPYSFLWEKGPPKPSLARFQSDPYVAILPKWQKQYGDRFIQLEKRKETLFSSCLMEKGADSLLLAKWRS